ncbi:hypothetical protein [Candidatus Uabimicrobium amorphum]|uniref:Uncharacterized protein n=1 Tax=Uabimicrobium amorphum TaxID=2596890 RepID=A0A5S9IKL2_UABAM|nr:hypothetical protein [Candidatus Uabimicrobium amorphum]BBM83424.1 hypothetical protein UABAM_01776 [Candidatus Uabimicrobium amorphum]
MKNRRYHYVGPIDILRDKTSCERVKVTCYEDVVVWSQDHTNERIFTFVIDDKKNLWIADRHCEHVACARGKAIFAAGEITFSLHKAQVLFITNQSTGYCPEPESWEVVKDVLAAIAIDYPPYFNQVCIFRRCTKCMQINIVKDHIYECAVCESPLDTKWNFHP